MHLAAGLRWGCYSASPDPLATTIKGRGGREERVGDTEGQEGKDGWAAGAREAEGKGEGGLDLSRAPSS